MSVSGDDYTKGMEETVEFRKQKLTELVSALEAMTGETKESYLQAVEKSPELLNEEFYLLFLRCERFTVKLAAKRICKYWDERIFLFGPIKAFEPLTLEGALREDEHAARLGVFNVLPGTDSDGRKIIWVDGSAFPTEYEIVSRESLCRYMWYCYHTVLLESEATQKHGLVALFFNRKSMRLNQFDRKRTKLSVKSVKGCLPVRLRAIHLCQPPTWFSMVFPIIRIFLGERLRKRVLLHKGSMTDEVFTSLSSHGMDKSAIPTDIGGSLVYDPVDWFEERRRRNL